MPVDKRKTIKKLKIVYLVSLKNLTKFEYFLHLSCELDRHGLVVNSKKYIYTKNTLAFSIYPLEWTHIFFNGDLTYSTICKA